MCTLSAIAAVDVMILTRITHRAVADCRCNVHGVEFYNRPRAAQTRTPSIL